MDLLQTNIIFVNLKPICCLRRKLANQCDEKNDVYFALMFHKVTMCLHLLVHNEPTVAKSGINAESMTFHDLVIQNMTGNLLHREELG